LKEHSPRLLGISVQLRRWPNQPEYLSITPVRISPPEDPPCEFIEMDWGRWLAETFSPQKVLWHFSQFPAFIPAHLQEQDPEKFTALVNALMNPHLAKSA